VIPKRSGGSHVSTERPARAVSSQSKAARHPADAPADDHGGAQKEGCRRRVMTVTMIGIGLAGALLMSLYKYFADSNSRDLGTMSEKWLAEYKNSHP